MDIGRIVISKCGRDKGNVFLVVAAEGEYVFLSDGATRRFSKPKKKKIKHVQPTRSVVDVMNVNNFLDSDIRKALELYAANANESELPF